MSSIIWETHARLMDLAPQATKRYLYEDFNLEGRCTGLIGPRGVGKTTLMLQYIRQHLSHEKVIYFSADNILFNQTNLLTFVNTLYQDEKIRIFFIDEIHKYSNWSQELKNIYDSFPDIKVVFSGSSSLDINKGAYDLSRRAKMYFLNGLSFREYPNFQQVEQLATVDFASLLDNPTAYNRQIGSIPSLRQHFSNYLQQGYYPFVFESPETHYERINQVIEKTIHEDIASYYNLKTQNLRYFTQLLSFLATTPPGEVNTHNIANNVGIDNKTANHYLDILAQVGLIRIIYPQEGGNQLLRKAQKLLLNNTTLLHAINAAFSRTISTGTEREVFFNQAISGAKLKSFYSKVGDYIVGDTVFEIGGKNKTTKQIKDSDLQAFLVKAEMFSATQREIPLHYFGFLY